MDIGGQEMAMPMPDKIQPRFMITLRYLIDVHTRTSYLDLVFVIFEAKINFKF